MERDVMDIIKDKEFIELTAAERAELSEMCSTEDEFNQVKSMFAGISAMNWSNPTPKAETKERLDHLFAQKHPKAAPVWYNAPLAILVPQGKPFYRQLLIQAAAVGLLIFLAYPFVNSNMMEAKTNQVAAIEKEETSLKETNLETNKSSSDDAAIPETKEANEASVESSRNDVLEDPVAETVVSPVPMPPSPVAAATPRSIDKLAFASSEVSDVKDMDLRGSAGSGASQPGSTHPDGIFIGDRAEIFSVPASREPAVFDLLTSTF